MTGQTAVRPIGVLLGFECTLNPFLANPVYREVAGLPTAERTVALHDPAFRERLLAAAGGKDMQAVGGRLIEKFDIMFALGETPNYEPDPRDSVAAIAQRLGRLPAEVALDAMLENDGTAMLWVPFSNYGQGNLDGTRELLTHPYTVPALSDGGHTSAPSATVPSYDDAAAALGLEIETVLVSICRVLDPASGP